MNTRIKIYNTLSGKKEQLKPLKNKKINMFVCGPTVYDFAHIGHARTYIIFDCFAKYLKSQGFGVFHLQNITDIDDKIIARSREKGVLPKDLAEAFTKEHLRDMKLIGIDSINKYAKATSYIKEIISQVKRLIDTGYAYKLDDGIYYNISKFKNYGKLSGRTMLQAEDSISRIDYAKNKINRGDFCLWKINQHQNEPSWPSQFGRGRPGWHIEDTAIAEKFFGFQYDIHGGGIDLLFPHHEAEISQMEAISGKRPMSKYWMHAGFLTINGQKMSKSLNNFITINNFLKRHPYQLLRFWVAKNLWKSPVDYSESAMIEVKTSLEKIEEFLRKIQKTRNKKQNIRNVKVKKILEKLMRDFYNNLADDFNTPKAFASIFEFIKEINKYLDSGSVGKKDSDQMYKFFEEINEIFNFIDFKKLSAFKIPVDIEKLLKEREVYRKSQNWQKADELRVEIEKYGFTVEDTENNSILKKI